MRIPCDAAAATVVTYPAPAGEAVSSDYAVTVNGRPVDVYLAETMHHDKRYYLAYFDFSGEVEVRVASRESLANAVILPESCGLVPRVRTADEVVFTTGRPFKVSVERDGENSPLLLFGNPLETDVPRPDDLGVVYFGPGVHTPGKIVLASNQTLYVAGGAVVKGGVEAHGEDITVRGRGIIDGSEYPHGGGPIRFMLTFQKCRNVAVRDVIIRGSWLFTIAPCGCDHVNIDNVKICGSRVGNDDGIDIINSADVVVNDCFLRTDDDCIAVKGVGGYDGKACERIRITHCSFWTDRANIFRIGYESDTAAMRDLVAEDIDVLHCVSDDRPPETFWSNWVFYLQPSNNIPMTGLRFEDFRINAPGQNNLVKVQPMVCRGWGEVAAGRFNGWDYKEPGLCVRGCVFRDIHLGGNAAGHPGRVFISGVDAQHTVADVTFENVTRFGKPLMADAADVIIGPHASGVRFQGEG